MKIKEPTGNECENQTKVYEDEFSVGYALWYPQMGGYVGKCVAVFDKHQTQDAGCINCFVWHDGDFPFSGSNQQPRRIHHCDPMQFIVFGQQLNDINKKFKVE